MKATFRIALAGTLALGCLSACGILRKPDMNRTAEIARLRKPSHPLIIIPGFLGSKLRDPVTGKVLWGTMGNVLSHPESYRLACSLDSKKSDLSARELEPYAIYDSLWGVEYYRKILRTLQQAGGYQLGDIRDPRPGDNAFVFAYDWRKDIVDSAILFSQAVDHLKAALGDPDLRFDLVAHSQGGLLARYYAKYGATDVLNDSLPAAPTGAGAGNLNKVILLGTPNQGTLEALKILDQGVKKVFRPMPPAVTFTMPALYEMLPPDGINSFAGLEGDPIPMDLYDPQTWVDNRLSVFAEGGLDLLREAMRAAGVTLESGKPTPDEAREFLRRNLDRARRFQAALAAPTPAGQEVIFHAVGSDCIPTLKTAVVLEEKGRPRIYFSPRGHRRESVEKKMAKVLYGPGDGTVLMESLLNLPESPTAASAGGSGGGDNLASSFFICESHGLLPNDPIFQNNLFYLLLYDSNTVARRTAPARARVGF
jgi:pimeloyl-ACP methyl ester carboxylesterase